MMDRKDIAMFWNENYNRLVPHIIDISVDAAAAMDKLTPAPVLPEEYWDTMVKIRGEYQMMTFYLLQS